MATQPSNIQQTFRWEGINTLGQRQKGEITAANIAAAQTELRQKNINITKIGPKKASFFTLSLEKPKKKITNLDILLFTRQLTTMLAAGLPIVKALEIVGEGHENPSMGELVLSIKNNISAGQTLTEALSQYPKYFDNLYCSLINAGERSGTLDVMLERISRFLEKSQTLKKKIKKASMYPMVVMSATIAAAGVLLIFVVPKFQETFSSFGAELPYFTQLIVKLSDFLQHQWWLILLISVLSYAAFSFGKKRSEKFAFIVDKLTLRLPVIGPISQKATVARFARTLSTTLASGMPIVDAMGCVNNIIDNRIYKKAVAQILSDISSGQQMSVSVEKSGVFSNLVIKMIAVGEESGALEEMLNKIASYFEEDVDSMVDNLSALLEPLIMVVLGVIIGGFVVAMYLPIFRLGEAL